MIARRLLRRYARPALLAGCALWVTLGAAPGPAGAADYALTPRQVAPDTWVVVGRSEDFSRDNGGDIANTAFVATGDGVVVLDSGPTRRYGEALRAAIGRVTREPIREVWNTHHHPDHVFGNQAFAELPIGALASTRAGLAAEGEAFLGNVYRMTGDAARGTELVLPTRALEPGEHSIGRHRFRLLQLAGHTTGDLAVLDLTTGVLFAGDLVFNQRAPTTPHADPAAWLQSLDTLAALPMTTLVPGHGEPTTGDALRRPIKETQRWLNWLTALLRDAAAQGLDAAEIAARPLPAEFATLPLARQELIRSLAHLFRQAEMDALR